MKKRLLSTLLAFCIVLTIFPATAFAVEGAAKWDGVSVDTEWYTSNKTASSYTISTAAELAGLATLVNDEFIMFAGKTIELVTDIDLNNQPWTAIGQDWSRNFEHAQFRGNFNGNNHLISNLYVNVTSEPAGLFGQISRGTIQDLNVTGNVNSHFDSSITYTVYGTGGIVASTTDTNTIQNCSFAGSVTGYSNVGGIVGSNNGSVRNCSNSASVIAELQTSGGIVGSNSGTIELCNNTGTISTTSRVSTGGSIGGIAGESRGYINQCYNTGNITGTHSTGGIIGSALRASTNGSDPMILNCYNTGSVSISSGYPGCGGIVGDPNRETITIDNCYNIGSLSGEVYSGTTYRHAIVSGDAENAVVSACFNLPLDGPYDTGGTPITAEQFAQQATFDGWDFGTIWEMSANLRRPILKNNPEDNGNIPVDPDPVVPSGPAVITALYPANGSIFEYKGTSSDTRMRIFFDREVSNGGGNRPELDFSVGTLEVRKADDDSLVYRVQYGTEVSLWNVDGSPTAVVLQNAAAALDYDTAYYVTMPEGFIKLVDGAVSPAIEKGDWEFKTAEERIEEVEMPINGYFYHNSTLTGKTEKYKYTYDDKWFFSNSYEYQHDLTKMSLCMAMAAYGADHTGSGRNIRATMEGLDFQNCVIEYPTPECDSIGYAIGTRTITSELGEKASLVLVAVRGGGYGVEWGGDFRVGYGKTHEGFARACNQVVAGIEKYFAEYGDTFLPDYKVWVVGYSRGAATANLVAKALDDGTVKGVNTKRDNIFAFCFECPQNTREDVSDTKYNNIINIANPIDFVTKVAMSRWNYSRYGRTLFLPYAEGTGEKYDALYNKMVLAYHAIAGSAYYDDVQLAVKQIETQAKILDVFMNDLSDTFVSPQVYTTLYQLTMINLASDFLGKEEADWDTWISVVAAIPPIVVQLASNPANKGDFGAVVACGGFKNAHYAEMCLAWLNALNGDLGIFDDPYEPILSHFGYPIYREVFINCPVDVEVYNSTNQIVAKVLSNSVQEMENSVVAYIDGDDQIVIALPIDEEYRIELVATDSGTVTYTATEYNLDRSTTEKVISYYEVSVEESDRLIGLVEDLGEVSSATYPLYLNDSSNSIVPSVNQSGESIQEFAVIVSVAGNGAITGGGRYVSGEFAKVTATANIGETFLGWYVDNTLVSADMEYRFLVSKDVSIVAKFTQNSTAPNVPVNPTPTYPVGGSAGETSTPTTYSITIPDTSGGSVTAVPKSASKGSTVTLTVTPNEGYELASLTITDSKGNELELTDKGNGKYTFVMPNSKVTVTAVFQPIQGQDESQVPQNTPWVNPFTDVTESAWYYDAVKFVSENSLMNGIGNNLFAPDANLSRAQLAQILYNKEGKPAVSSIGPFTDVNADAWYADAVIWAAEKDIVGGYGNGLFGPDDNITREQLAVMLWRYAGEPIASADLTFSDADRISGFAQSAIRWAVENEILNGKGGNVLDPNGFATRAEVAQMLTNYLG